MKKSIITIEVLVALVILFLVIVTSTTSIKFFHTVTKHKETYQDNYITMLSLKDKLSDIICKSKFQDEGIFNNFKYTASCIKVQELRNFKKAIDLGDASGNIGNYLVSLYRVDLTLNNNKLNKNLYYYVVQNKELK